MKICPKCGAANKTDSRFCDNCGNSLIDVAANEPVNHTRTVLKAVVALVLAVFFVGAGMLMIKKALESETAVTDTQPGEQAIADQDTAEQKEAASEEAVPEKEASEEPPEEEVPEVEVPKEEAPEEEVPREEAQEETAPEEVSEHGTQKEETEAAESDKAAQNEAETKKSEAARTYNFPGGTLSYKDHHYYIYEDVDGSWDDAMSACISRGGYLAVINDSEENEALFEYMLGQGFEQAYFGITDEEEEGNWKYVRGDDSTYTNWGTNSAGIMEPNNADGRESHAMLDVNMHNGHWNDAQFGRKIYTPDGEPYKNRRAYICEWGF